MRGSAMLLAMVVLLPGVVRAQVTSADCQRHRAEFIAGLEDNRKKSIRQIDAASRETRDARELAHLEAQRNEAWEFEERMRANGDRIYRDCMDHVKVRRTGG